MDRFVSHSGKDDKKCGQPDSPCRSLRYAVRISGANDIIYIDHAGGTPYDGNGTILLEKSLKFSGYDGKAVLTCASLDHFFTIDSPRSISKIVFENLAFHCPNSEVLHTRNNISSFELAFLDGVINGSIGVINSLFCSIQVINTDILGKPDTLSPMHITSRNLITRFAGSNFTSSAIELKGKNTSISNIDPRYMYDVSVFNCIFKGESIPANRPLIALNATTYMYNVTIRSSKFINFHLVGKQKSSALMIHVNDGEKNNGTVVLDRLVFENLKCDDGVINFESVNVKPWDYVIIVGIYNSMFINTTKALVFHTNKKVEMYNNTFRNEHGILGTSYIEIYDNGYYLFESCNFSLKVSGKNLDFQFIRVQSSPGIEFKDISSNFTIGKSNKVKFKSFIIVSFIPAQRISLIIKGDFNASCPTGYNIISKNNCVKVIDMLVCTLYSATCEQCPRNEYSLDRGELHSNETKTITCHDCPHGGNCIASQVTARPNYWGYRSNTTVTFLQCPPKYCCDQDYCEHYNSCYGNRVGTLCGECPSGMSESLFNTKCTLNENCSLLYFMLVVVPYLVLYLLFFLFQEDYIFSKIERRIFNEENEENEENYSGGLLKIIFYYYQVIHLLRNVVGPNRKENVLENKESYFYHYFFEVFNFLVIGIPCIDCPKPNLRAVKKAVILHSVGYCLLSMLLVVWLFSALMQIIWKKKIFKDGRVEAAFTNISILIYSSSAQLCISFLHCVTVGDSEVLFLDGGITCFQPHYYEHYWAIYLVLIFHTFLFFLVPLLGPRLLMSGRRIGVKQFCIGCIFPLGLCILWLWDFVAMNCCSRGGQDARSEHSMENYHPIPDDPEARNGAGPEPASERINGAAEGPGTSDPTPISEAENGLKNEHSENIADTEETRLSSSSTEGTNSIIPTWRRVLAWCRTHSNSLEESKKAIIDALSRPFRFPNNDDSNNALKMPWESFLLLRRLVMIVVLTIEYDFQIKLFLALSCCVVILVVHMRIQPFKSQVSNDLETLSLASHVVFCVLTLIKVIYYREDFSLDSDRFLGLDIIEILLIFPVAQVLLLFFVVFCTKKIKCLSRLKFP